MTSRSNDLRTLLQHAIDLHQRGNLSAAEQAYRDLLNPFPDASDALHNLGVVCMQLRRPINEALALLLRAWIAEPENMTYARSYLRALELLDDLATASAVAAHARWQQWGDPLYASERFERDGKPPLPEAVQRSHTRVAQQFIDSQRLDLAEQHLRAALVLNPASKSAFARLYNILRAAGRLDEAQAACRAILHHRPDFYDGYVFLGSTLAAQGRDSDAEKTYRAAIAMDPDKDAARSALLFDSHYAQCASAPELRSEADAFGEAAMRAGLPTFTQWRAVNASKRSKKLRIGLVSGDLHAHPVGYFLQSVLAASKGSGIDWFVYSNNDYTDATSSNMRGCVSRWQSIAALDDVDAAALIERDEVNILVDLAGHTTGHRLYLFARRPAPVQVTWLGYFATTGVPTIDYILVDPIGVEVDDQVYFSEKFFYLPVTRLLFTEPTPSPDVSALPSLRSGHITLGSFQPPAKITDAVLTAWSKIMHELPSATLRCQSSALSHATQKSFFAQRLARYGIESDRVNLIGGQNRFDYFSSHAAVDLVLDTFPYPGGTTTCDALWMGVPTVTLRGDSLLSRQGASLLNAAGLADWIAPNVDAYVALAIDKARSIDDLAALRSTLRAKVRDSPLMDAPTFVDALQCAFETMWQSYVSS